MSNHPTMSGHNHKHAPFDNHVLSDVHTLLNDIMSDALDAYKLSPAQFQMMILLDGLDGQRLTLLSEQLHVAKSTITRMVDRLEDLDYVKRVSDEEDRRAQRVMLTPTGQHHLQQAQTACEAALQEPLSALESDEQQQLTNLLHRLREQLVVS